MWRAKGIAVKNQYCPDFAIHDAHLFGLHPAHSARVVGGLNIQRRCCQCLSCTGNRLEHPLRVKDTHCSSLFLNYQPGMKVLALYVLRNTVLCSILSDIIFQVMNMLTNFRLLCCHHRGINVLLHAWAQHDLIRAVSTVLSKLNSAFCFIFCR
jgi:hypothetical protein